MKEGEEGKGKGGRGRKRGGGRKRGRMDRKKGRERDILYFRKIMLAILIQIRSEYWEHMPPFP